MKNDLCYLSVKEASLGILLVARNFKRSISDKRLKIIIMYINKKLKFCGLILLQQKVTI